MCETKGYSIYAIGTYKNMDVYVVIYKSHQDVFDLIDNNRRELGQKLLTKKEKESLKEKWMLVQEDVINENVIAIATVLDGHTGDIEYIVSKIDEKLKPYNLVFGNDNVQNLKNSLVSKRAIRTVMIEGITRMPRPAPITTYDRWKI